MNSLESEEYADGAVNNGYVNWWVFDYNGHRVYFSIGINVLKSTTAF